MVVSGAFGLLLATFLPRQKIYVQILATWANLKEFHNTKMQHLSFFTQELTQQLKLEMTTVFFGKHNSFDRHLTHRVTVESLRVCQREGKISCFVAIREITQHQFSSVLPFQRKLVLELKQLMSHKNFLM